MPDAPTAVLPACLDPRRLHATGFPSGPALAEHRWTVRPEQPAVIFRLSVCVEHAWVSYIQALGRMIDD